MEKIPKKLYKYVSLDLCKKIVKDQTIKFSVPLDFNDPFDCDVDLVDFDFKGKIDFRVSQEIETLKIQFKDNKRFNENATDPLFWQKVYKGGQIEKVRSCRVSCFSLQNDIVLMWSHYADKHNGVCLEFDNTLENRFVNLTNNEISEGEVGYEAHERINYVSEDRHYSIYKLFLNKSESWSHEKEYRMILINNKPEIQKFHSLFLSSIYFGVKVTNDQIKSIISEFNYPMFKHLKFQQGFKDNLAVKFSPIDIDILLSGSNK